MSLRFPCAIALSLGTFAAPLAAQTQHQEPLCLTVETRRLMSGPFLAASRVPYERVIAQSFPQPGDDDARFLVGVRDTTGSFFRARSGASAAERLGPSTQQPPEYSGRPGLVLARMNDQLRVVGSPWFFEDPGAPESHGAEAPLGLPVAITLPTGVLVLELVKGDVYGLVVRASGATSPPQSVATPPAPPPLTEQTESPPPEGGFVWLSAVPYQDGAIALAQTDAGQVVTMRFDRQGARVGAPDNWPDLVAGPLQLLPTGSSHPAALFGRPIEGTGPDNEQARVQVLVPLQDSLRPTAALSPTQLGQYPLGITRRRQEVLVFQWAASRGFGVAAYGLTEQGLRVQPPSGFRADPPIEGVQVPGAAVLGPGDIAYDLALYRGPLGTQGHLVWQAPSGDTFARLNVLPVHAITSTPALLPAQDGVVVVMATEDETGAALDAFHIRCDLVTVPAR